MSVSADCSNYHFLVIIGGKETCLGGSDEDVARKTNTFEEHKWHWKWKFAEDVRKQGHEQNVSIKVRASQSIVLCKDKSPAASPHTPTITHALSNEDLLVNPCLNQNTQKQTPQIQKNTMACFPTQSGQLWEGSQIEWAPLNPDGRGISCP